MFECSEQTLEALQSYEHQLIEHLSKSNCLFIEELSHIVWDYDFLGNYIPSSEEEALLITTARNKMGLSSQGTLKVKTKPKKKRIRWADQIRPSSPFSINSKNISKQSLLKNRGASPNNFLGHQEPSNKDLELLYQSVNFKGNKKENQ